MTKRRRFTADFKAKVALEALRGDKTIQEIAARHKVHPNQLSTWKRQAMDGLSAVFSAPRRPEWTTTGRSTISTPRSASSRWNAIFWPEGSSDEPGGTQGHDRARPPRSELEPPSADDQPLLDYAPKGESPVNLALMRRIDELFLKYPFYGSRQMVRQLRRDGVRAGRHRVRRLMRLMGLQAIYQAPRTSDPHPSHRVYPYLLKGMAIERPNQVWCADITYIPVRRGFLYLVAIMDWATRHVLAWRLSNTMDASFCVEALAEALGRYGRPEIFNTDQGSQFTGRDFTGALKDADVAISMDGRGRYMDNIFIERLWRSLKYEARSTCTS